MPTRSPIPVLFYDGECGLCAAVVGFILENDERGVLRFAALQGKVGQQFLRNQGLDTAAFDSLVFVEDWARADVTYHLRTAGAVRALAAMGGDWADLARVLSQIPPAWLDLAYRVVAKFRYRIWGRNEGGPAPRWAHQFWD